MDDRVITIVVAIIGSGAFATLVQALIQRHYESKRGDEANRKTLAAVSYWVLSNELERLLSQGYATPEQRLAVDVLYDAYKSNGWNGDMDARMERLLHMPTANIKEE